MKRTLQIWFMLSLSSIILSLSSCFTSQKLPPLPKNTDALIEEVFEKGTAPDFHLGRLDTVCNEELCIHFESIGDEKNPTILLVMGYGTTGLAWKPGLIQPLLDASFHVVRFDNRDTGKTRWIEGKDPKGLKSYLLADMAKDACRILDKLGKEKAHIVGVSMGGMIAQCLAINHPERVHTVTSISSSGYYYDPKLVSLSGKVLTENAKLIMKYGRNPQSYLKEIKKRIYSVVFLRNDDEIEEEFVSYTAQRYLFQMQNDYVNHKKVDLRHGKAIRKSGSRYEQLKNLKMPFLLIHGTKDALIWHQHTEKYAQYIPNNKEVYIDGMGHVSTVEEEGILAEKIIEFIAEKNSLK